MTWGKLIIGATLLTAAVGFQGLEAAGSPEGLRYEIAQDKVASFKGGVDIVRIAAVVRDRKGRFVQDLTARDFEVLDSGKTRPISDFRTDVAGGSVALLFGVPWRPGGCL